MFTNKSFVFVLYTSSFVIMALLITGLSVLQQGSKTGGQSPCRVKQETTDLQFL